MAIQTSLFEQLRIEKITFEHNAQHYSVCGTVSSYGQSENIELFLHYTEVNQILNQYLKNEESTHLYSCLKSYETPDGLFYEMDLDESLNYCISIDMNLIRSFQQFKKCA